MQTSQISLVRFAAALLLVTGSALADGMPILNGRFEGQATVIMLTKEQQVLLDEQQKQRKEWERSQTGRGGWDRLPLTKSQKALLAKESGKPAPTYFQFYDTRVGENDCTCHAANRALRFSETRADIPHAYLMSDKAARKVDEDM